MNLLDKKILIVTGKGGTGKTTVAAAIGLWSARQGKNTLIVEWIFNGFWLMLAPFFDDFSCFVHCLFEAVFLMICYSFLGRSLNWANPKIIDLSLV